MELVNTEDCVGEEGNQATKEVGGQFGGVYS